MPQTYRPRRQSAQWLDGDCPPAVLAIYDNGGPGRRGGSFDRFTVFYVPTAEDYDDRGYPTILYRGMSEHPSFPQGFGISDTMPWHQARAYRTRVSHHAARWSDLPDDVKAAARRDAAEVTRPLD